MRLLENLIKMINLTGLNARSTFILECLLAQFILDSFAGFNLQVLLTKVNLPEFVIITG